MTWRVAALCSAAMNSSRLAELASPKGKNFTTLNGEKV